VVEVKRPILELKNGEGKGQLTSYMRQLKTDLGLLIGRHIQVYYDGKLNQQRYPLMLANIPFRPESDDGQILVGILERKIFIEKSLDIHLQLWIDRYKNGLYIEELITALLSSETKQKINNFLKNEYAHYGDEIVKEALRKIEFNVCPVDIAGPTQATSPRLRSKDTEGRERNELNHGFGTKGKGAEIDEAIKDLLDKGENVTAEAIAKILNLTTSRVRGHIRHLEKEHGYDGTTLGTTRLGLQVLPIPDTLYPVNPRLGSEETEPKRINELNYDLGTKRINEKIIIERLTKEGIICRNVLRNLYETMSGIKFLIRNVTFQSQGRKLSPSYRIRNDAKIKCDYFVCYLSENDTIYVYPNEKNKYVFYFHLEDWEPYKDAFHFLKAP
jgi:hypothetical protein